MNTIRRTRTILFYSMLIGCWCTQSSAEQASAGANASPAPSGLRDGQHDFDFNIGVWKTHFRRLLHPLTGSTDWVDLDGTVSVQKIWNGRAQFEEIEANGQTGRFEGVTLVLYDPAAHQWRQYFANSSVGVLDQPVIGEFKNSRASLLELEATGPAGHVEGVGLRLYNPKSHQWSLNWANSGDGDVGTPMVGGFSHGQGQFYDHEEFQGKFIFARNGFSDIKPDSSHFEQAFSNDGGKDWETNWDMTFTR